MLESLNLKPLWHTIPSPSPLVHILTLAHRDHRDHHDLADILHQHRPTCIHAAQVMRDLHLGLVDMAHQT